MNEYLVSLPNGQIYSVEADKMEKQYVKDRFVGNLLIINRKHPQDSDIVSAVVPAGSFIRLIDKKKY